MKTKAELILEKHWTKATKTALDPATKKHLKYCIDAIEEALQLALIPTKDQIKKVLYDCAKSEFNNDGFKIERVFQKEAESIIELFKKYDHKEIELEILNKYTTWLYGGHDKEIERKIVDNYLYINCSNVPGQ